MSQLQVSQTLISVMTLIIIIIRAAVSTRMLSWVQLPPRTHALLPQVHAHSERSHHQITSCVSETRTKVRIGRRCLTFWLSKV
jgi:hypothetical protein